MGTAKSKEVLAGVAVAVLLEYDNKDQTTCKVVTQTGTRGKAQEVWLRVNVVIVKKYVRQIEVFFEPSNGLHEKADSRLHIIDTVFGYRVLRQKLSEVGIVRIASVALKRAPERCRFCKESRSARLTGHTIAGRLSTKDRASSGAVALRGIAKILASSVMCTLTAASPSLVVLCA